MLNDKQFCQKYYILALFAEIAHIGIQNGTAIELVANLKNKCLESWKTKLADNGKDFNKMISRCKRKAVLPIFGIFSDHQTKTVNTHKMVLAMHQVALVMKNDGLLDEDVEDIVEQFLDIESKQDETFDKKPISDADWLKLKASADKKVADVLEVLKSI
jgi:hypothetical protein